MTDETRDQDFGAHELRAQEAVRALSRPEADPAFRTRLRASFATGAIDAGRAPRETVRRGAPAPLPAWRRFAPLAVAVAAIVLLVVPYVRTPGLHLVSVHGTDQVIFNGQVVSCADLTPIQAALLPGCRIEAPEGAVVQLARAGELLVDFEGVEFTFPGRPLPIFRNGMESAIRGDGTVRMATAPGFAGSEYRLQLGDTELRVRDSVFRVHSSGGKLDIDVLEGEVEAVLPDGRSTRIRPRSGATLQGGEFTPTAFDPAEDELLRSLRDRAVTS